jgi:predicted nuclease with RNAse H fold
LRTLGIDVSSQAKGTAACRIRWEKGSARIEAVEYMVDDDRLEAILSEQADKIGIDVPLGWPDPFVDALERHRDGQPFGETDTSELARRYTDKWVYKVTGQLPLSVTTDRISYPAMRTARILGRLPDAPVDRSGAGDLVEVYPAAALRVWHLQHQRYKRDKGREVLAAIIKQLRERCSWLSADDAVWREVGRSDHAFDALICALIARAHAIGQCHPVPDDRRESARSEGWIAVPREGTLETLATQPEGES